MSSIAENQETTELVWTRCTRVRGDLAFHRSGLPLVNQSRDSVVPLFRNTTLDFCSDHSGDLIHPTTPLACMYQRVGFPEVESAIQLITTKPQSGPRAERELETAELCGSKPPSSRDDQAAPHKRNLKGRHLALAGKRNLIRTSASFSKGGLVRVRRQSDKEAETPNPG